MNYYKLSHGGGRDISVIVATSDYEALGYYVIEVLNGQCCVEDIDKMEIMSPDEKIEVECIGFPRYKTINEIHKEQELWFETPRVVTELIE